MEWLREIQAHPLYTLMFGGGGVLIILIGVLTYLNKKKSNNPPNSDQSPTWLRKLDGRRAEQNEDIENQEELEAISFVAKLKQNSPVSDEISLTKHQEKSR